MSELYREVQHELIMDISGDSQLELPTHANSHMLAPTAKILRDEPQWLAHIRQLRPSDIIILLTPVIMPLNPTTLSDPFEPFGRSLSSRHGRIRHVPYTQKNGITSTHVGFIKRGHAIILCLAVQPYQQPLAEVTLAVSDNKPVIVVHCSPSITQDFLPFPTTIQVTDLSRSALEATAAVIFADNITSETQFLPNAAGATSIQLKKSQPRVWKIDEFEEQRDLPSAYVLWSEYGGVRFKMDCQTFTNVLRKPGYSKHYVVRDPLTWETIGFCATYLSYVDREGEKLVASLAILIVHPKRRLQGIGLSLHGYAVAQLKRTRGITRLQLGSIFPRILYGPPFSTRSSDEWLRRRGWILDRDSPGQGQSVYDLLLDFKDWKHNAASVSTRIGYRLCTQNDMTKVLEVVEKASAADDRLGWFDQYWALINGPNVKDIIVATEGHNIVGTALTYRPGGSQIASDLPWASQIGNDVGGVTCISVPSHRKAAVLSGLMNACMENLQRQGMTRLFLDGVTSDPSDLHNLGFREWARYRDVWKTV